MQRFCAKGVATAVVANRFSQGLPEVLQKLPVKLVALFRHPADVVIERLQAKAYKGVAPFPECTVKTIGKCADALCSSMEALLDSLKDAKSNDRLKLLKWESLARRRHKVAGELMEFAAEPTNSSRVEMLGSAVEEQNKAFSLLAKASPISVPSLLDVERRCARVMDRLGFAPTATTSSGEKPTKRGKRSAKKGRKAKGSPPGVGTEPASAQNGTDLASGPLLLLQHAHKPAFRWCPVRLTAAEALARFFVRLTMPRATTAPPCFPNAAADRCPVPRSAAWLPKWGSYPLDVVEVPATDLHPSLPHLPGGFSFAFVRNPWVRLASAYSKLIAVEDRRTAVHRSWIREMHGLGEKEPIGFSHFVRWVAAQDSSSMHRAWRPYTRSCRFDSARYSFIGRHENFEADVGRLMTALGMGERERKLWDRVSADTRPMQPLNHPDRLLKLYHLYFSDDRHDLVEIVRTRYREDIDQFGYMFPRNTTLWPWGDGWRGGTGSEAGATRRS